MSCSGRAAAGWTALKMAGTGRVVRAEPGLSGCCGAYRSTPHPAAATQHRSRTTADIAATVAPFRFRPRPGAAGAVTASPPTPLADAVPDSSASGCMCTKSCKGCAVCIDIPIRLLCALRVLGNYRIGRHMPSWAPPQTTFVKIASFD